MSMAVLKLFFRRSVVIWMIFLCFYVVASAVQPIFLSWGNTTNLLRRAVPLVLVGIGQTIVMLTAGIDLSVGSVVSLANVIAASLPVNSGLDLVRWFVFPLLTGVVVGFINGVLVGYAGLPALVVTLATGTICLGVALFVLPEPGGTVPFRVARAFLGNLGPIPVPLLIIVGAILITAIFLLWTRAGRELFAVGENERIAGEAGISVRLVKVRAYMLSGFWAAAAGVYLSCRMYSGDPLSGQSFLMDSILVGVLGGTSLTGGQGTVAGIIPAALLLMMIYNILNLMGVPTFYQFVVRGLILMLALALPGLKKALAKVIKWSWAKP